MRVLALRTPRMRGADVRAAQQRLRNVKVDGEYGPDTGRAVYSWKWRVGFRAAEINTALGLRAQAILLGTAKRDAAMVLRARGRAGKTPPIPKIPEPAPPDHRQLIVAACRRAWENSSRYSYRQYRPMPSGLFVPEAYIRTDCSTYATNSYREGGAPDPNGRGYDGLGYTGTLQVRGEWTRAPRPGDLAFYGYGSSGVTTHVAIHAEDPSWVYTFGSNPMSRRPLRYRGDYRGSKTYPLA